MSPVNNANLPQAVYSASQVAEFDRQLIEEHGVPGFSLMQRAAEAAYAALMRHWPETGRMCVLCGPGNNGGDGYLVARLALAAGWQVQLISLWPRTNYTATPRAPVRLSRPPVAGLKLSSIRRSRRMSWSTGCWAPV